MAAYRRVYDSLTCRLTPKYRDQLRNPTLCNRVWAIFTFFTVLWGCIVPCSALIRPSSTHVARSVVCLYHRRRFAMVATAPGEKLLKRRRPVRNWTQLYWQLMTQIVTPYDVKLVFVQKITFVPKKINKNCCHQSCTF